ncbi:hypothetical protein F5J12DRAFT_787753 [Pisolithus orientalis]|uniref:uncharacterized protein n=1 Tax=Pisolithus orientalis TaxID=936130 RepID=UPI002224C9CA|nr:uncharacterized protein F5J12DRAFT_787753 [Pisolithus orientalis]KAI5983690.1 hypothetical protein F5J12DRAFT_787753 [Pisolithus orientalis]
MSSVQPLAIATFVGGLETAAQLTPYKNFIQWSGKATGPGAEMFLINGNHHVTLIQTLYEKDIVHCQDAIVMIHEGQNERQKGDAAKELEKINEKLSQKAVWLVEFFDLNTFLPPPFKWRTGRLLVIKFWVAMCLQRWQIGYFHSASIPSQASVEQIEHGHAS